MAPLTEGVELIAGARWDERFRETLSDPDNVLIRFLPETAVARDVSYEAGAQPPA